jgi:hypothetical protein
MCETYYAYFIDWVGGPEEYGKYSPEELDVLWTKFSNEIVPDFERIDMWEA